MKNTPKISFILSFLILLGFYSCYLNKEKVITMFLSNSNHENYYHSTSVNKTPSILWKVKTNGQVISSPCIYDNTIYIGSNDNNLYSIDAIHGDIKWSYKTNGAIPSSPAVANGKIFFLSYDGFFYCLLKNGKLHWKFKTGGEKKHLIKDYYDTNKFADDPWDFYLSSPVIKNNTVYFGSSDAHVYALDIETGEKIWSFKTEGSVHSSPAIYENSLFVGDWASKIYSLNATTGKENWSYTTGQDTAHYIWIGIQASPSVDNGVVYIGSRDASVYAFDAKNGDTLWVQSDFKLSWMPSSIAITQNTLYTGSSDGFSFYSIDKKTGNINYETPTNLYTFSTPAIDNTMAYIGSSNGRLYGIHLTSGEKKWEFRTIASKTDSFNKFNDDGTLVEGYNKIYNTLNSIEEFTQRNNMEFQSCGAILSSPIIHNQVIYFGSSDGYIYAVTDK